MLHLWVAIFNGMTKNKKQVYMGIYIVISVVIIIGLIFILKKDKVEAPNKQEATALLIEEPEADQVENIIYKKKVITPKVDELNNISYTEAFMKYRDGRLIQFAGNCQSHPNRMVIANGSELMLDNRSNNKEIISLGNTKYILDPYGFKIIHLNVPKIPTTYLIDCAVSQNVNTLIIE